MTERIRKILLSIKALGIEFYITGSILLKEKGIISRNPEDIDLVIDEKNYNIAQKQLKKFLVKSVDSPEDSSADKESSDSSGTIIFSRYMISGIKLELFLAKSPLKLDFTKDDLNYTTVHRSLVSKLYYIANNKTIKPKHFKDLYDYMVWREKLPKEERKKYLAIENCRNLVDYYTDL
jgi:hypothetical protein